MGKTDIPREIIPHEKLDISYKAPDGREYTSIAALRRAEADELSSHKSPKEEKIILEKKEIV